MKPGAGQGSPLRVVPTVQKILRRTFSLSRAELSYLSYAASRTVPSEIVLDRAVPNVAAGVGPCGDGNRLSNSVKKRQAMAGSGLEAAAVVGGSAVEGRGGAGCVLLRFVFLVDVPVVQVVFWCLARYCARQGCGPDSVARGFPQLHFLDKVLTCPLLRRLVHEGAVLGQGCDMPDCCMEVQFLNKVLTCPLLRRQVLGV